MSARDPWTIVRFGTVDSTQTVAAELVERGAAHRTAVVAGRQTAGYGRNGGQWSDTSGDCLLATLIVRPAGPIAPHRYAMIAALATIEAVAAVAGLHARTKWPNDVRVNGAKVAGILGDATWQGGRLDALRVGIGINIAGERAEFRARDLPEATSLSAEARKPIDREAVLSALLSAFSRLEGMAAVDGTTIAGQWRRSLGTLGRSVVATGHDGSVIAGTATGTTDEGDLVILTASGDRIVLVASQVRTLRHTDESGIAASRP